MPHVNDMASVATDVHVDQFLSFSDSRSEGSMQERVVEILYFYFVCNTLLIATWTRNVTDS